MGRHWFNCSFGNSRVCVVVGHIARSGGGVSGKLGAKGIYGGVRRRYSSSIRIGWRLYLAKGLPRQRDYEGVQAAGWSCLNTTTMLVSARETEEKSKASEAPALSHLASGGWRRFGTTDLHGLFGKGRSGSEGGIESSALRREGYSSPIALPARPTSLRQHPQRLSRCRKSAGKTRSEPRL